MIIKSIQIKKFRGFDDVQFLLGTNLTAIAGQNGTQKTTLLGIITQPFTISNKSNPLFGEKPLSGGNFRSLFREKFKLSDSFDLPKSHEWTLNFNNENEQGFTVESIRRDPSSETGIRFWKKGSRKKGSGYIQLPVIFLSLSRLFPIGEDSAINSSTTIKLTPEEFQFYQDWHNRILLIPDVNMTSVDYLASRQKNTLGANTSFYDWRMNSAGQDNIGKILLAILSFKRLMEKYPNDYRGGILAIDELDTTLYSASQLKLIDALRKFSSNYNIQIIFTTHSLTILKKMCELQNDVKISGQNRVVYLQKRDLNIVISENILFDEIINNLNVTLSIEKKKKRILIHTEDNEATIFLKTILKGRLSDYQFANCTLGCGNLIDLARKNILGFKYLESIIVLDGDVKTKLLNNKLIKNILVLPGKYSPERLVAEFLLKQSDASSLWDNIHSNYTKQIAFKDYTINDIRSDRIKAKDWFITQKKLWGRNCSKVINLWINENQLEVNTFLSDIKILSEKYNKHLYN